MIDTTLAAGAGFVLGLFVGVFLTSHAYILWRRRLGRVLYCPDGHLLNEDNLCGVCWHLDPTKPSYRSARVTEVQELPPSSNPEWLRCSEDCDLCAVLEDWENEDV